MIVLRSSNPAVLINTVARDTPSLMVAAALKRLSIPVKIYSQTGLIGIEGERSTVLIEKSGNSSTLDGDLISNARTVWNRRFPSQLDKPVYANTADYEFIDNEARSFLKCLSSTLINAIHVNPMTAKLFENNKGNQIITANKVGLNTPDTLITNDPAEVRRFSERHGMICTKPFSSSAWKPRDNGKLLLSFTTILTESDIHNDDSISITPSIYQPYIKKSFEVRITHFGNFFLATKIDSQKNNSTSHDWRVDTTYLNNLSPLEAPPHIKLSLKRLFRDLNILFGSADFIVTPDGDWVFLEVNEAGQFTWQEIYCEGSYILEPFARFLADPSDEFEWDSSQRDPSLTCFSVASDIDSDPELARIAQQQTSYYNEGIGFEIA